MEKELKEMEELKVRDFIQKFLIEKIGMVVPRFPFPAFVLMSIGIEFLGKCLRDNKDENNVDIWDTDRLSRDDFEEAIKNIKAFEEYKCLIKNKKDPDNLYSVLRCGLAHLYKPKFGISLGTNESIEPDDGTVLIRCEKFYEAFKEACEHILEDGDDVKKDLGMPFVVVNHSITGGTPSNFDGFLTDDKIKNK